jgi:2-haloacid dehalogenase
MRSPTITVFDVGNVLIQWDPRHLYRKLFAQEAEMEHFLGEICTQAWNEEQDRGRSFAEGVALLLDRHPAYEAYIRAFDERWHEMVPGAVDGTVSILEDLRRAGYPTYAITNFSVEKFAFVKQRFAFLAAFDGIVISGEERVVKPNEAIYRRLLDRFGLKAEDCLFIDDSERNVEAAKAVGMQALHFSTPPALAADLARLGFALGPKG